MGGVVYLPLINLRWASRFHGGEKKNFCGSHREGGGITIEKKIRIHSEVKKKKRVIFFSH